MKRIRLTESQLHRLIKTAINEEIDNNAREMANSLWGKQVYTPWSRKQKVSGIQKSLNGDTFLFFGGGREPFMNLNASELYQLIQDGEMDGIILINNKETEDWLDEHDRSLAENPPMRH